MKDTPLTIQEVTDDKVIVKVNADDPLTVARFPFLSSDMAYITLARGKTPVLTIIPKDGRPAGPYLPDDVISHRIQPLFDATRDTILEAGVPLWRHGDKMPTKAEISTSTLLMDSYPRDDIFSVTVEGHRLAHDLTYPDALAVAQRFNPDFKPESDDKFEQKGPDKLSSTLTGPAGRLPYSSKEKQSYDTSYEKMQSVVLSVVGEPGERQTALLLVDGYDPYCVAYGWDRETGTWSQGSYHDTLESAVEELHDAKLFERYDLEKVADFYAGELPTNLFNLDASKFTHDINQAILYPFDDLMPNNPDLIEEFGENDAEVVAREATSLAWDNLSYTDIVSDALMEAKRRFREIER